MSARFHGTFDQKIDDKGRVNVPQKFRDVLRAVQDDRIYITYSRLEGKPCLDAYPYEEWGKFLERLEARKDLDPDLNRFYYNVYLPGVQECLLDRQGRILLPTRLRDHARLGKDVVFTGIMHMFRIWDRDAHQTVFESSEQVLIDNPRIVPGVGI
jgi:MraZ protein